MQKRYNKESKIIIFNYPKPPKPHFSYKIRCKIKIVLKLFGIKELNITLVDCLKL